MKRSMQISVLIIFSLLVVFPQAAMSEVKVTLKNGRDIIADSCSDLKDRIVCVKMGGTFEVQKKDIKDFRSITIKNKEISESPVAEPVPVGEVQKEADKSAAGTKDPAKQGETVLTRGANPEQEKRLDQINQRKLELKAEREKLSKDREQLNQDVKAMGTIYKQEQFDEITRRISDVEDRVNRFNEEVKKLNEEEAGIIEGLNKRE